MRTAVSILAALLLVAAFPAPVPTAPQADAAFEQLATLVTQKMAEYSVPGVAFGVLKNGQLTTGQRIHEAMRGLVIEPIGLTLVNGEDKTREGRLNRFQVAHFRTAYWSTVRAAPPADA